MKFNCLIKLFRGQDWSREMTARIDEALQLSLEMFQYAAAAILEGESGGDPDAEIYRQDRRINALQQEIRRGVLQHLSADCSATKVPSALVFMNVAKDAERVGDYMKNLYEIAALQPQPVDRDFYRQRLGARFRDLEALFDQTQQAFVDCDEAAAAVASAGALAISRQAEAAILEATRTSLPTGDAVCLALAERFCGRIAGHLANILSSVVMPVDRLDSHGSPQAETG